MGSKSDFPPYLEPGYIPIVAFHPASKPVEYYVHSSEYLGFPFGAGKRIAIHGYNYDVKYQDRDGHLMPIPDLKMDEALRNATGIFKRFVIVGRLAYFDAAGYVHQDEVTCNLANVALGMYNLEIHPVFFCVEVLYLDRDLTQGSRVKRCKGAEEMARWLQYNGGMGFFRYIPCATSTKAKEELARNHDRIVWVRWSGPYNTQNDNYVLTSPNEGESG